LLIAIVSEPLVRGPPAWCVRVTLEDEPVLALAVTLTAPSVLVILDVSSGSAFAKLMADAPSVNFAREPTAAFTVRVFESVAAKAAPEIRTKVIPIVKTKLNFFIFSSPFHSKNYHRLKTVAGYINIYAINAIHAPKSQFAKKIQYIIDTYEMNLTYWNLLKKCNSVT